ncbi:hypothetical protein cypCar_00036483 [Cyprinus carpio]|nr:hypothetical protein cypCar_00036483 [Cyprinus carpio]
MRPPPPLSTSGYFQTTPAAVTASATSSAVLRSSSRPTKGTRQSSKTKSKPTSRIPANPYNYGPIIAFQTKSPVPLDCPTTCTCNLQISDLGLNVNCQERKIENISDLKPKPYNPKKINHFQNLPVSGVLDQLKALVQIDLFENPWDCSCDVVGMKIWLEQLNTGTVVNDVKCVTPKRLAGQDMRVVPSEQLCPDYSDVIMSTLAPSEEPSADRITTTETPQRFNNPSSNVPLSVLILSLLLVFIMSVFVAAGLFVVVMKRRKKSQSDRTSTNNSDVSSFNLQYNLYSNRSVPKVKAPAGHVYEYIPHPLGHMCKNPIYRSREGNAVEDYPDLHELKVTYRSNANEEQEVTMRSPNYTVSTIEPCEQPSPVQDAEHFFRGILEPDKSPSTAGSRIFLEIKTSLIIAFTRNTQVKEY